MKTYSFPALMAVGVGSLFLTANIASSQILFSDNFDGFASPSTVTASGIANGYRINGRIPETLGQTEDFGGVHFNNEFSGARLNGCEQLSATEFLAVISPENTPINTSPWYAFKVWADGQRYISIRFTNTYTWHRGRPWLSRDGQTWKRISETDYHRDETVTNTAVLRLKIGKRPVWVASQEMIGLKELGKWTDKQSRLPFARSSVIGSSVEGRPIRQVVLTETTNANRARWKPVRRFRGQV